MADVDLHLHTTASDGRLTPASLVALAADQALKVIAITDHDSTDGLEEAYEEAGGHDQLQLIPGIELGTDMPGAGIHVLGYYIQYKDSGVQGVLEKFRLGRVHRARGMVEKLHALGIEIEWERVQEIAGDGSVGRPHIALAMVEKGYISHPKDAFTTYLGRLGSAYVEREKLTPREAVLLIRSWGGAAVLAHPAYIEQGLDEILEDLKSAGLVGMEVYYAQYSEETINELADLANRHNLLPCGGSDYHALGNPVEPLPGAKGPTMDVVGQLERLASSRN